MLNRLASLIVVGMLLAAIGPARADVWRMAGSFNGWSTTDESWTLKAPAEGGDTWVLDRAVPAGTHTFKFVKNGDWSHGHFGRGAAGNQLEQPGENLTLRTAGEAVYRIALNPNARTWSARVISVEKTVFDVRLLGPTVDGRSVLLDASRTLTVNRWDRGMLSFEGPPGRLGDLKLVDRFGKQVRLPLVGAGPMTLKVTLRDGEQEFVKEFALNVEPEAMLRYNTADDRNDIKSLPIEPIGPGLRRALVTFAKETDLVAVEVDAGGGEMVRTENTRVPAGTYAIEVRDGAVVTQRDPSLPLMFIPGNWRLVNFAPAEPAESVHLTGDFNGWARPGRPGSIELASRSDGAFFSMINLPMGTLRYRFIVDGALEVTDPASKWTAPGPGGAPASVAMIGPGPREFPAPRPNAIERLAVRHDPASALDFMPIARSIGLADVRLTTLPGDVERVSMTVEVATPDGRDRITVPMMREASPVGEGFDTWTARVMTGEPQALYSFTLTDGMETFATDSYSASVEPSLDLPTWAMGAVWYQIFPERFRNGNPLNDPSGPGVYNKPWTDDWYVVTPEEERSWRERYKTPANEPWPPRQGGPLFHVVWDRRYGGDLQGVAEKFEYLRELGVTAIYFNPIFEAESMHKYDATDYRHIDDNLASPASAGKTPDAFVFDRSETGDPKTWRWSAADRYFVEEFLPGAKRAGLRVVLDGVFNHTGKPFFAFRDIEENGDKSPYKDWFFVKFDENGKLKSWESWFNTGALPKFRQQSNGDLVPPVKEHIFGITRRWMDPNGDGNPSDGIDGWRLDVALDVGLPFWRDWRALVKSINPEAVIIAEIWDDASPHMTGDTFDTQMNYPFAKPVIDWLGVRPGMASAALGASLLKAFDDAPQTNLIHQNLFGSHDTDRFVSMLQNPGREYDQGNRIQDHDYPYKDVKPSRETYRRSMLGVAIQALYQGAPMVYYGDEVGMWGADDPTDRKPFPWNDLPPPDSGKAMKNADERADWDLQKEYAKWLNLRADPVIGPVLRLGATRHIDSGDPNVFAFERSLNGRRVIAVINRQDRAYSAGALGGAKSVGAWSAEWWMIEGK